MTAKNDFDDAPSQPRSKAATYGLTAVTLGDVLKGELDQAVQATGEGRSEIIRTALERYFEHLPELQKRRREDREKTRDLQYLHLFSQLLDQFERVLREFDYADAEPLPKPLFYALQHALDDAREWLASRLPSGLPYQLTAEMGMALSDISTGFHRLFREADGAEWQREGVDRWRKKREAITEGKQAQGKEKQSDVESDRQKRAEPTHKPESDKGRKQSKPRGFLFRNS